MARTSSFSSIEVAVKGSQRLEGILRRRYGATGSGLGEKLDSVKARVPADLHNDLRWVARERNRVVHEEGAELEQPHIFMATVNHLIGRLDPRAGTLGSRFVTGSLWGDIVVFSAAFVVLSAFGFWLLFWSGNAIGPPYSSS